MMGIQLDFGLHDAHHVIKAIELVVDSAKLKCKSALLGYG